MKQKKWYCVGEDVESTQELAGTPEENNIDPKNCRLAASAREAYKQYMNKA